MTAAEIYESMDKCMESCKRRKHDEILPAVLSHAAKLGSIVGRTEEEILRFYFKMRDLGERRSE